MAKKKAKRDESVVEEIVDPFIGGEEDDLSDMQYIQDETTSTRVETHPPETDEEAAVLAEQAEAEATTEEETTGEETKDEIEPEVSVPVEEAKTTEETEETEEAVLEEAEKKIPYERFEEVNKRMKKAEETVEQLKKQLEIVVEEKSEPEPEPYDYAGKEKAAMDALLEGDSEKYAELRNEIRLAEKEETLREAKKLASQGDQLLQETLTFEETGAKIEADFPQFVENNEEFNKEAYDELMDLYVGYTKSGSYSRAEALQRAADKAAKIYDLSPVSALAKDAEENADNIVDIKKADVKRKTKIAESQPPVMESAAEGEEEPTVDVKSMSDEHFSALPESTKRRIRGDIL